MSDSKKEYVLDITLGPPYAFCPYEEGNVVLGLMIIQENCPGVLIGLWADSNEQANLFEKENPNWRAIYA